MWSLPRSWRTPASRRISRPTRWTSTRWCRSSRTPTGCESQTSRPRRSSRSAKPWISSWHTQAMLEQESECGVTLLTSLLDELPEELARQVFTHASWTERRSDSYARLAFLGDSVLALAVTAHLYPRLEAERFGAGRLTKIRAQAVSGASCRVVAERLALPERLRAAAPAGVRDSAAALVETERVLASVIEAVIGACYLHARYERTARAVVEAFGPEIEEALE